MLCYEDLTLQFAFALLGITITIQPFSNLEWVLKYKFKI